MVERLQAPLPHPCQQLAERRVPRQVRPDDERVDEEADEVVQRLVVPPGGRRSHREVGPGAEPRQQHGERGLHHHVRGDALQPRQLGEPGVHLGRHLDRHQVPPVRGRLRPGPVEGQLQLLRRSGQRRAPVRDLPGDQAVRIVLVAERLPLPERVVGVLHGQRLPLRRPPVAPRRVCDRHVPRQRPHRPAVTRDVMDDDHQHPLARPRLEQPRLDRRLSRQVEGVSRRLGHLRGQVGRGDLDHGQLPRQLLDRHDVLVGLPLHVGEDRPQHLVPPDHVPQRRVQRRDVHLA